VQCYTAGYHEVGGFLGLSGPDRCSAQHAVLDGVQIVTIAGEADIYMSGSIERLLQQLSEKMPVIVDLRACSYIDSSVIATLIRMRKRRADEVGLVVEKDSIVARVIDLTQIGSIIPVSFTLTDARRRLQS
jgi:anti-anti-sigma factor